MEEQFALAEALVGNKTLTTLRLNDCSIANAGARALAKSLEENDTLTILDLENNKIDSEGIGAIADALRVNKKLSELVLLGNTVPGEGALSRCIDSLEHNTTLLSIKWRLTSRQSFKINSGITRNNEILRRLKAGMSVDDIDPHRKRERDEQIRAERDAQYGAVENVSIVVTDESLLTSEQITAEAKLNRENELKKIENKVGVNVFQEMERQREEERRKKFSRFSDSSEGSTPTNTDTSEAPQTKKISSPFTELEKKS